MKKRKLSLLINISVICLCVCAIAIGVYSVKNANLSVTGTIGFDAHDCQMLIKGTMQGYTSTNGGTTTTAVTKYFSSNNASDGSAVEVKSGSNESWKLGALYFDDLNTTDAKEVNDIVFTFEITNDSDFYVDVTVNQDLFKDITDGERIYIYAPNNGETLSPRTASTGKSVTLIIKFQLQKDASGNYSSLNSAITIPTNKSLLNFKKTVAPAYLTTGSELRSKIEGVYKSDFYGIESVKFLNKLDTSTMTDFDKDESGELKCVSVSDTTITGEKTEVYAYMSSTSKKVIIYSPARIYAPSDSTNLLGDFWGAEEMDFSNFDTSKVTNMHGMFDSGKPLTNLDLTNFDTTNVIDMGSMFSALSFMTAIDLRSFDTSKVTDMSSMFNYCSELTTIYVGSGWNTDAVTSSEGMFKGCSKLPNFDSTVVDKTNAHAGVGGYLTSK